MVTITSPTATPSSTSTPAFNSQAVVYPNPSDGTKPIQIGLLLTSSSDVKVQFFTVAFRKVKEKSLGQVSAGAAGLSVDLSDSWGIPLASGLYYLVVTSTPRLGPKLGSSNY
jgi:hypothetical protein